MIIDHFAAIEADFQRFYALNLPDALWGRRRMSARRLASLVRMIPSDSATARASSGWSNLEELLALNAELSHATWRLLAIVHSKEGAKIPDPLQIPRPGRADEPAGPSKSSASEVTAFFGAEVIVVESETV